MKFKGYPQKKNQLIGRLKDLTGAKPTYNGVPDFSYDIGSYRVLRDGSMVVLPEKMDDGILERLINEGLVVDENYAETVETNEMTGTVDLEKDLEPGISSSPLINSITEEEKDRVYNEPIVIKEHGIEIRTMVNLLNMIGSKGEILSKAVGRPSAFWISENVLYDIAYERPTNFYSLTRILRTSDRAGLLRGLELTPDSITFSGFPQTNDFIVRQAYEELAKAMYAYSKQMKYISNRKQDVVNEKYYFRNWMNHLGLGGPQNKTFRDILMKRLCGNSSYRTRAQMLAYEAGRARKRKELQAAATAAEA